MRLGADAFQFADGVEGVLAWHVDVKQNDIGTVAFDLLKKRACVRRAAMPDKIGRAAELQLNCFGDQRIVIDAEDFDRLSGCAHHHDSIPPCYQ